MHFLFEIFPDQNTFYFNWIMKNGLNCILRLVPLKEYPYDVMKKVVELFYFGETKMSAELHKKVLDALKSLRVDLISAEEPTKGMFEFPTKNKFHL